MRAPIYVGDVRDVRFLERAVHVYLFIPSNNAPCQELSHQLTPRPGMAVHSY